MGTGENPHYQVLIQDKEKTNYRIDKNNTDIALDYIRGNLFNPSKMIPLPHEKSGPDNDLNEKIQHYIGEAIEKNATIYALGERWGPEEDKLDKYFRFSPGNDLLANKLTVTLTIII